MRGRALAGLALVPLVLACGTLGAREVPSAEPSVAAKGQAPRAPPSVHSADATRLLRAPHALGFSEGLAPLSVGAQGAPSARACARCHAKETAAWRTSMHARSLTDPLVQEGFAVEPRGRCLRCHAPLAEQARELVSVIERTFERDGPRGRLTLEHLDEDALAREGITCAVCHVREGAILTDTPTTKGAKRGPHTFRAEPALAEGGLCRSCHEFRFERVTAKGVTLTDEPTQTTHSEWLRYRAAGGDGTCVSCHMKGGDHRFLGAHDDELLTAALKVRAEAGPRGGQLWLESQGVGHALPSGDLYRHLRVEVAPLAGGSFVEVSRLGREWGLIEGDAGVRERRLARDTSLAPGEVRQVDVPLPGAFRWRVRYFFTHEKNLSRSQLPLEALVKELWRGEAR